MALMIPLLPYRDLAIALAIGLLIGIERGWRARSAADGSRVAGVRTFGLLGLFGGLTGILGAAQPFIAGIMALGVTALLVIGYRRAGEASATTEVAAFLAFGLGVLATSGFAVPALVAGVAATLLLSQRQFLHGMMRGMTERDIKAIVRFAIIAGAIWPLLPNRAMGPYNAWNPFELWLVVVVVCAISFAGYAAGRFFGATRGTLATAAIGGLYSSTAVTAALAQRLRSDPAQAPILSAGIAVASAVMFARVLVLTAILVPFALPRLAMIIVPAGLVALIFVWRLFRAAHGNGGTDTAPAGNPFEILPAMGFALFVALLALLARWAQVRFGDAGVVTLLMMTGAMDVDAAIVTMRGLPPGALDPGLAGAILALPVLLNTLFKAGITVVTGKGRSGWQAALPLLTTAAVIPLAWLATR